MKHSFLLLFILLSLALQAQDLQYGRYIDNQLSSETFKGRGFVKNGDKIAANFIKSQLDSLDVKSFNADFYQNFKISVNTFPDSIFLSVNGQQLVPGQDYLIDMQSKTCKGKFDIVNINLSEFEYRKKNLKKKFVHLIDDVKTKKSKDIINGIMTDNLLKAGGYIIKDEKLTHEASKYQKKTMIIHLKTGKIALPLKTLEIDATNHFYKKYTTQNIIGYVEGNVDSFIVFSAHYDHLGMLGKQATFNGANDNASGCAMVLTLADYFVHLKNKPHYSVCFLFFSAEEEGILGSYYFVEHPIFELEKIKFLINLDMVGTGQEGIQIVNSTIFTKETNLLNKLNNENNWLVNIKKRGAAANSDHYPFYAKGVPSFFIYTLGGNKHYHDIYDKPDSLSFFAFENLSKLMIAFTTGLYSID